MREEKKEVNFPIIRQFTASTTIQKLLARNAKRKAVLIFNNGIVTVELLSSEKSVYGQGIPILSGAIYESDHFNPQGEYFVVAQAGTCDLRIEETIKGE